VINLLQQRIRWSRTCAPFSRTSSNNSNVVLQKVIYFTEVTCHFSGSTKFRVVKRNLGNWWGFILGHYCENSFIHLVINLLRGINRFSKCCLLFTREGGLVGGITTTPSPPPNSNNSGRCKTFPHCGDLIYTKLRKNQQHT
jgi:hypothetical protein